jgi:HEAT repeat protein
VKEKNPAVIPILDKLWSEKPVQWESLYAELGPAAEAGLIQHLATSNGALRQSLVRLLGKVGTEQSLPLLEAAVPDADPELRVLIEKSSDSIRKRLGQ